MGIIAQGATALAAIGALVFTALSLQATQEQNTAQNSLTAQAQYTDRYTKAVDQLGQKGDDRLQIRLGGIYALERLAADSSRDQPTIIEVLSAFVRTSSPNPGNSWACSGVTTDVQAAVTVLGRRDVTHDRGVLPDLRSACLRGASLDGANMQGWKLHSAVLQYAQLSAANLTYADLSGADLTLAKLHGAALNNANLRNANLNAADVTGADLSGAIRSTRTQTKRIKDDLYTLGKWW